MKANQEHKGTDRPFRLLLTTLISMLGIALISVLGPGVTWPALAAPLPELKMYVTNF